MSTTATISEAAADRTQLQNKESPEKKELWFIPSFNAGDLDGVMAHFEPGAVLVTETGAVVAGLDGVREAFREAMWNKLTMAGTTVRIVQAGGVALLYFDWALTEYGGTQVSAEGTAVTVLRRRDDGRWFVVVEDPFSRAAQL